jgi:hypothetical protein
MSDDILIVDFLSDNLDLLDEKAALDADLTAEAGAREDGDTATLGDAKEYADGLIEDLSVTLTDAAGSETLPPAGVGLLATVIQTMRNNLKSLFASVAGKAPTSHAATATTYGASTATAYGHMRFATDAEAAAGTATDKAVTPKQLATGLDGVITVQTVTVPTSAWTSASPSTATVACEGMTADMTQDKFDVRGLSAAQAPVEASAGLGNTDIVPGNGTIKLTCIGVVPTVELKIVVTIYG